MKILMLLNNPFVNDNRVLREAKSLVAHKFNVNLICTKEGNLPDYEEIEGIQVERIITKEIFDIKNRLYKKLLAKQISEMEFDIIHCHDQDMLNIGVKIKNILKREFNRDIKLIYDSHELFHHWPLNFSNYKSISILTKSVIVRKLEIYREKINAKHIDHLITVNHSLANDLKLYFKLKTEPIVLRNIPEFKICKKSNILKEVFNIESETKILGFIGANIYPNTLNLEQVIAEFANQPNIAIVFIAKKNNFQKQVEKYARSLNASNVFFHDIIHPDKINEYLSSCDVGLVPTWNKKDLSYWYALDNKLFEYLIAEIPILATKQPEYINIIENYKIGVCVNPDVSNSYLIGFKELIKNSTFYKENIISTKKILNWENEEKTLLKLYNDLN